MYSAPSNNDPDKLLLSSRAINPSFSHHLMKKPAAVSPQVYFVEISF